MRDFHAIDQHHQGKFLIGSPKVIRHSLLPRLLYSQGALRSCFGLLGDRAL